MTNLGLWCNYQGWVTCGIETSGICTTIRQSSVVLLLSLKPSFVYCHQPTEPHIRRFRNKKSGWADLICIPDLHLRHIPSIKDVNIIFFLFIAILAWIFMYFAIYRRGKKKCQLFPWNSCSSSASLASFSLDRSGMCTDLFSKVISRIFLFLNFTNFLSQRLLRYAEYGILFWKNVSFA